MSDRPTVLVIQNSKSSTLGRFEPWWQTDGLALDIVAAYDGAEIPALEGYSGLVMLGGGLMPDDDEHHGWLADERARASEAVQTELPVLGICLGGQLLAHVIGGTVRAQHGLPESGSTVLTKRAEAVDDELFGPLGDQFTAMEHRKDAITALPERAVWLASSERCPIQGFRVGERAWGLQFHPEMSGDRVSAWNRAELEGQGFDPDTLVATAAADESTSAPVWRAFARRFADVVIRSARS
ncbi:MAG: type 1 glutamine amidotransferase [Propionibacteriales bacterium]|nr:type 1 glutamine amidotransferase [Propionibacteriales bacterium]